MLDCRLLFPFSNIATTVYVFKFIQEFLNVVWVLFEKPPYMIFYIFFSNFLTP